IAIKEAKRLNIPVFAIVDTNCDPDDVDQIVPANDDAVKTIELIVAYMADAVNEGAAVAKERKAEEAAEAERVAKENESQNKPVEEEIKVKDKRPKKVVRKTQPAPQAEVKEEKEAIPKAEVKEATEEGTVKKTETDKEETTEKE
ncbi:MAG: 30S ribosomal protein S2, partial [Ignavibacteriaceae bacterium]